MTEEILQLEAIYEETKRAARIAEVNLHRAKRAFHEKRLGLSCGDRVRGTFGNSDKEYIVSEVDENGSVLGHFVTASGKPSERETFLGGAWAKIA